MGYSPTGSLEKAKPSVRVATTANIGSLSGLFTLNGVALADGDRVLVKDQTTGSENGIYVASTGAWSRASDANQDAEVLSGDLIWVQEGTTDSEEYFVLTTVDPIVVGVTSTTYTLLTGGGGTNITGSGTASHIAYFDGATSITSESAGELYWDSSLNRLGLGTSSPNTQLHVNVSSSGTSQMRFTNTTTGLTNGLVVGINALEQGVIQQVGTTEMLFLHNGSNERMRFTTTEVVVNENANLNDFRVESNSNTHMVFVDASTNEVGIGASTPNEVLTVEGAISLDEITAPAATAGYGKLYVKSSDSLLYFKDDGGTEYNLTAGGVSGSGTANHIAFFDGASSITSESGNELYWDSTNNRLGLHTSTPAYDLDLDRSTDGAIRIRVENDNAGTSTQALFEAGNGTSRIQFGIAGTGFTGSAVYGADQGYVQCNGNDLFLSSTGSVATGVYIHSDPGAGLALERIGVNGTGELVINEPGEDYNFRVEGGTNANLIFADAGLNEVGIGTATPNEILTVEGAISLDEITAPSATTGYGKFYVKSSDSLPYFKDSSGTESPLIGAGTGTANHLAYFDTTSTVTSESGGELYWDPTNNRLGIGTSSPSFDVDIDRSVNSAIRQQIINDDPGTAAQALYQASNGTTLVQFGISGTGFTGSAAYPADSAYVQCNGGDLYLSASSGTSADVYILSDSGAPLPTQRVSAYGTGEIVINEPGEDYDFRVESNTNTHMFYVDAGNGRIGVNQSAPISQLHLSTTDVAVDSALFDGSDALYIDDANRVALLSTSATASNASAMRGLRARGTPDTPTAAVDGDRVFTFLGGGFDGTSIQHTALIEFNVNGAVSAGNVPQEITFVTSASSAGARADRLTVTPSGPVHFHSAGSAAAPTIYFNGDTNSGIYQNAADQVNIAAAGSENLRISSGFVQVIGSNVLGVPNGSVGSPSFIFNADPNTGIWAPAADQLAISAGGAERIRFASNSVVINQDAGDVDFRVEGTTNDHLIGVDAGNNRVGIGTNSANEILTVGGVLSLLETTAPTNTANHGKIYVKSSDSLLYFKDDAGTEYDLTAGGGGITGSGTANRIAYFDGASSITSESGAELYWDSTNNHLGIGTATPDYALHVFDTSVPVTFERSNVSNNVTSSLNLKKSTAGIMADGFGPGLSFVVEDNDSGENAIAVVAGVRDGADDTGFLRFQAGTGATTNVMWVYGTEVVVNEESTSAVDFRVETNTNTHGLFVDSSANAVGINEATPTSALHIDGDFRVDANGNAEAFYVNDTSGNVGVGSASPVANLHVSVDGNVPAAALTTSDAFVASGQSTAPGVAVVAAGAAASNRGVFKGVRSDGTLASPTPPAQDDYVMSFLGAIYDGVVSQGTAAIDFYVDGSVSSGNAPQRISFVTSETNAAGRTERLVIKSDGMIGVNNTDPTYTFDVSAADAIAGRFVRTTTNTNTFHEALNLKADTSGSSVAGFGSALGFAIEDNNNVETTIAYIAGLRDNTDSIGQLRFSIGSSGTIESLRLKDDEAVFNDTASSGMDFRVESDNETHALFVQGSTDRVAIGTSSPSRQFHVNATSSEPAARFTRTESSSAAYSVLEVVADNSVAISNSFGAMIDFLHGDNLQAPTSVGRFGTERFNADNSGRFVFYPVNAGTEVEAFEVRSDQITVNPIGVLGDVDFRINDASGNVLMLADGGAAEVGIGTATTNELLTVEGVVSLDETTAPGSTSGYTKLWADSTSSRLHTRPDNLAARPLGFGIREVLTPDANTTLLNYQSGAYIDNGSFTTGRTITLPSAEAGLEFYFTMSGVQTVTIQLPAGDVARSGPTNATSVGGTITSSTSAGTSLHIVCVSISTWFVMAEKGTWTYA